MWANGLFIYIYIYILFYTRRGIGDRTIRRSTLTFSFRFRCLHTPRWRSDHMNNTRHLLSNQLLQLLSITRTDKLNRSDKLPQRFERKREPSAYNSQRSHTATSSRSNSISKKKKKKRRPQPIFHHWWRLNCPQQELLGLHKRWAQYNDLLCPHSPLLDGCTKALTSFSSQTVTHRHEHTEQFFVPKRRRNGSTCFWRQKTANTVHILIFAKYLRSSRQIE